jgi:hypothetical protein
VAVIKCKTFPRWELTHDGTGLCRTLVRQIGGDTSEGNSYLSKVTLLRLYLQYCREQGARQGSRGLLLTRKAGHAPVG